MKGLVVCSFNMRKKNKETSHKDWYVMNLMTQSKESDSYLDTGDDASSSIKASTRDPSMLFELIAKRSFRASQNLSNQTSTVLKQRPAFNLASKVDEAAIPGERFLGILMLESKKLMNLKAPNTFIYRSRLSEEKRGCIEWNLVGKVGWGCLRIQLILLIECIGCRLRCRFVGLIRRNIDSHMQAGG